MSDDFIDLISLVVCEDIGSEHDYLVAVLGFESAGLERLPNGTVVHGEVRAGRRRIWLHPANEAGALPPPAGSRATGGIVIQVADVDSHFERVRDAGATIVYAPRDMDYGQREYGVRDPEGHLWWIATATRPPATR